MKRIDVVKKRDGRAGESSGRTVPNHLDVVADEVAGG